MSNPELDWELVCDVNDFTKEVVHCYFNAESDTKTAEIPEALAAFIKDTQPSDWIGHLSTSHLPFRQFYTHKASNISVWDQPPCLQELRASYTDNATDWSIRSKSLEMTQELQDFYFDFDQLNDSAQDDAAAKNKEEGTSETNENQQDDAAAATTTPQEQQQQPEKKPQLILKGTATSAQKRAFKSKQLAVRDNARLLLGSTYKGKLSANFVCFYRNTVTQECSIPLPPALDEFQQSITNHRQWHAQLSSNCDHFFYVHATSNVCLWDIPLAFQINRQKHLAAANELTDWRIFISSEHKRPLYLHMKSKMTQFELPEPFQNAQLAQNDPAVWNSGLNPVTGLTYYHCAPINLTMWHVPRCLSRITRQIQDKLVHEQFIAMKEDRDFVDTSFVDWIVQYVAVPILKDKKATTTEESSPTATAAPAATPASPIKPRYICYYKHSKTLQCTVTVPLAVLQFVKTTKLADWIKVNVANTDLSFYQHAYTPPVVPIIANESQPNSPKNTVQKEQQQTAAPEGAVEADTAADDAPAAEPEAETAPVQLVSLWQNPGVIIASYNSLQLRDDGTAATGDVTPANPEDDIDNWVIFFDPQADTVDASEAMQATRISSKHNRRHTGRELTRSASRRRDVSVSVSRSKRQRDVSVSYMPSQRHGDQDGGDYDDESDDNANIWDDEVDSDNKSGNSAQLPDESVLRPVDDVGGEEIPSEDNGGASPAGNSASLLTSHRPQRRRSLSISRSVSISKYAPSTTQNHLHASTQHKGQQLYFNLVTKSKSINLPECFERYQELHDVNGNDDVNDHWESVIGKIAPCPYYRNKLKPNILMWHEPHVVHEYREGAYLDIETTDLLSTVADWSVRFVPETGSAYYKNNRTLWYQSQMPEALRVYQTRYTDSSEWQSFMSQYCTGVVVYCHIKPQDQSTGCVLLEPPECLIELSQEIDPTTQLSNTNFISFPNNFNVNVTKQANALHWVLEYEYSTNTAYYRNIITQYATINLPKVLHQLGLNEFSSWKHWKRIAVYFDQHGNELTLEQKLQCDQNNARVIGDKLKGENVDKNALITTTISTPQGVVTKTMTIAEAKRMNALQHMPSYIEKFAWQYTLPGSDDPNKTFAGKPGPITIRTWHKPSVVIRYERKTDQAFDWVLTRSGDETQFVYKNRKTREIVNVVPDAVQTWLDSHKQNPDDWLGQVDAVLKRGYYRHKPSGVMVHVEPQVLHALRTQQIAPEKSLRQWTIFANKQNGGFCYYMNKVTKQCVIGSLPVVLQAFQAQTSRSEWNLVTSASVVSKPYYLHTKTGVRLWDPPDCFSK